MDNLLSREEVKRYLEVEESDLEKLIEKGRLQAYKIGGAYLRFRKEEVLTVKQEYQSKHQTRLSLPWFVRLRDFWRFNNFYILSLLLIAFLFWLAIRF